MVNPCNMADLIEIKAHKGESLQAYLGERVINLATTSLGPYHSSNLYINASGSLGKAFGSRVELVVANFSLNLDSELGFLLLSDMR